MSCIYPNKKVVVRYQGNTYQCIVFSVSPYWAEKFVIEYMNGSKYIIYAEFPDSYSGHILRKDYMGRVYRIHFETIDNETFDMDGNIRDLDMDKVIEIEKAHGFYL